MFKSTVTGSASTTAELPSLEPQCSRCYPTKISSRPLAMLTSIGL